ncbi:MAG: bifunctional hydroxymethylpyrimidine kinase/phosphomethylpyrimidine kinase, partial [Rhodobacteraceae bacterium]|nr:bifunctional hydroxymethylpyrimidine kinase/phosphomethylpyrimidine kinase [Paracoccaceae bacterium]
TDKATMTAQAQALLDLGPTAILLKGGHLSGSDSPDLLATKTQSLWLDAPRHDTRNTHGTGCTLSSALATQLGHGLPLSEAVECAKSYVSKAIAASDALDVGTGHGPVHHFHAFTTKDI